MPGTMPESLPENVLRNPDTRQLASRLNVLLRPHSPGPLIITHDQTSQFRFKSVGASSSCGLCASNFIRLAFTKYLSNLRDRDLLQDLLTRESFTESTNIAELYERNEFLHVPKLIGSPVCHRPFIIPATDGLPYFTWALSTREFEPILNTKRNSDSFYAIMQYLDTIASPIAAATITGPPEIIAVLKLPLASASKDKVFIVFDSHTYHDTKFGGASATICRQYDDAAAYLTQRFPSYEEWPTDADTQSQSLADLHIIDAYFAVPRELPTHIEGEKILLQASMMMLHLEHDQSKSDVEKAKTAPPAPAPASTQRQSQSRQPSKMELDADQMMQVKIASYESEMKRWQSEKSELQTKLLSVQDAAAHKFRLESKALQTKYQQQLEQEQQKHEQKLRQLRQQLEQQQRQERQHDKAGETCRSTCRGAEDARLAFEKAQRAMEKARQAMEAEQQAMEAERRATEKERCATEKVRHATEKERQTTEAERRATEKVRGATEKVHLDLKKALDAANKCNAFTKVDLAPAAAEETRYGRSFVRRALKRLCAPLLSTAKRASRKPAPVRAHARNDGRGAPPASPHPVYDTKNDSHRTLQPVYDVKNNDHRTPRPVYDVKTDDHRTPQPVYDAGKDGHRAPKPVYNVKIDDRKAVPAPPRPVYDTRGREAVPAPSRPPNDARNEPRRGIPGHQRRG
ncbi:hypothetical protein C0993_006208, partial [Termitomyces sp. T159_Od127]